MRKRDKEVIATIIFWIIFLPIWVIKRFFRNLKMSSYECNLNKSDINEIDLMSGIEFEEFMAALFKQKGLKVEMTTTTGDFGADLILEGDGFRTAVQCKRYSDLVGVDAVREVLGARDYYKANKLMVITNNYFTNAAKKQAESSNVILWDRGTLIQEIVSEPDRGTSTSEYIQTFVRNSFRDYKLLAGLAVVFFVYIPVFSGVPSILNQLTYNSSPVNYTPLSQESSQFIDNNENGSTSYPPTTIEEVTEDITYSKKMPGYLHYQNGRYGYSIEFPEEFSPENPPENGSGFTFTSSDGQAKLTVYGTNNVGSSIFTEYQDALNQVAGKLRYKASGKTWYVVAWRENGIQYYRKTFLGPGSENTFIFTFPEDQKSYYEKILEIIENNFRHGNTDVAH